MKQSKRFCEDTPEFWGCPVISRVYRLKFTNIYASYIYALSALVCGSVMMNEGTTINQSWILYLLFFYVIKSL